MKNEDSWGGNYLETFIALKCAPDVLGACYPIKGAAKEITEAMGIIRKVKKAALAFPMELSLIDMCSGNALVPVIAVHLLPIKYSIALDKRERGRKWDKVKRFSYKVENIFELNPESINEDIITAVHPCSELATRIIYIFNNSKAKRLYLMPCCIGRIESPYNTFKSLVKNRYYTWCMQLASKCQGRVSVYPDKRVTSPANVIITAIKENKE